MKCATGMIALTALLATGVAQAQAGDEPFATAGRWDIAAEPARNLCKMYRFYRNRDDGHSEAVVIRYDAARDAVSLIWSTDGPNPFPRDGEIDLFLTLYGKGPRPNEAWGSRRFRHRKLTDTRYFETQFTRPHEARRVLDDLAGAELLALYLGPVLMTSVSLGASEAVAPLRECAARIAARATSVRPKEPLERAPG